MRSLYRRDGLLDEVGQVLRVLGREGLPQPVAGIVLVAARLSGASLFQSADGNGGSRGSTLHPLAQHAVDLRVAQLPAELALATARCAAT